MIIIGNYILPIILNMTNTSNGNGTHTLYLFYLVSVLLGFFPEDDM